MTEADMKAMIKQLWGSPLTPEEQQAADRGWAGMSEWQSMSFADLDAIIEAEEQARSTTDSGSAANDD